MPHSSVNHPQRWRDRAKECRALAEMMNGAASKKAMMDVAEAYDRLAQKIEAAQLAPTASPSYACQTSGSRSS